MYVSVLQNRFDVEKASIGLTKRWLRTSRVKDGAVVGIYVMFVIV